MNKSKRMELLQASLVPHRPLAKVQWPVQPSERDKPAGSMTPGLQGHSLPCRVRHVGVPFLIASLDISWNSLALLYLLTLSSLTCDVS